MALTEREKSLIRGLLDTVKDMLAPLREGIAAEQQRATELRTVLDRVEQQVSAANKRLAALERKAIK